MRSHVPNITCLVRHTHRYFRVEAVLGKCPTCVSSGFTLPREIIGSGWGREKGRQHGGIPSVRVGPVDRMVSLRAAHNHWSFKRTALSLDLRS